MNDFAGTDYDFAAGSIQGLRGWNMDDLGRLHGVTHPGVWRPGENVSVCQKTVEIPCPKPVETVSIPKLSEAAVESSKKKRRRHRDELEFEITFYRGDEHPCCDDPTCYGGRHTVPTGHRFDPACSCGFWAYDEAGFKSHGSVIGVIEGYGKTTVGSKGFRSEKARIVALSCENGEGERHSRSVLARLTELYPDVAFVNNLNELIDEHPAVLRTWPEVGDEFWLQPVAQKEDTSWSRYFKSSLSYPSAFRYSIGGVV